MHPDHLYSVGRHAWVGTRVRYAGHACAQTSKSMGLLRLDGNAETPILIKCEHPYSPIKETPISILSVSMSQQSNQDLQPFSKTSMSLDGKSLPHRQTLHYKVTQIQS